MRTYIGIDPGFSGGFASIINGTTVVFDDMPVKKMGKSEYNALDLELLAGMMFGFSLLSEIKVGLENPSTRPGEAPERSFRFGRQIGNLEGMLRMQGIDYVLIAPNAWTAKLGMPGKDHGNAIPLRVAMIDRLYPDASPLIRGPRGGILDGRLDALLIAHYLRIISESPFGKKGGKRPPKFYGLAPLKV